MKISEVINCHQVITLIITLIIFIGLAIPAFSANVASFRKEKAKLVEYKKKCEKKDEPDRSECLEKYEKKKGKYKKKLAKFKQRSGLEDQKRQERKANSTPRSIEKDIATRSKSMKSFEDFTSSSCVDKTNSRFPCNKQ